MSVRLRMRVLRLRQLSTGRLYDRVEKARNLDLPVLGRKRCEPPPRMRELAARAVELAVLCAAARSGKVA